MSSGVTEKTVMSKEVIKGGLHNLCRTPDRTSFQYQSLDLSNLRMEALTNLISEFTAIRFLDLSHNLITDLAHLQPLVNLQELRLAGNRLKAMPAFNAAGPEGEGANFSKLRKLVVDQNKLTDLAAFKLPKLQHLSANENRIENLAAITGHPSLRTVEVRGNKVKSLAAFKELPKLQEIYAANNPIPNMQGLENLPELKLLHLRHTRILDIEEELPELPNLAKINLRETKMASFDALKRLFQFPALVDINVIDTPLSPTESNLLMLEVLVVNTKIARFNKVSVEKEDLLEAIYLSEYKWMESEKVRIRQKRKEEAAAAAAAED